MMTLGELILALEHCDPDGRVDSGFNNPHSYRGYYSELAFEPCGPTTVGEMLSEARRADGSLFNGYKGGRYAMNRDTPVWLSHRGHTGKPIDEIVREIVCKFELGIDKQSASKKKKPVTTTRPSPPLKTKLPEPGTDPVYCLAASKPLVYCLVASKPLGKHFEAYLYIVVPSPKTTESPYFSVGVDRPNLPKITNSTIALSVNHPTYESALDHFVSIGAPSQTP